MRLSHSVRAIFGVMLIAPCVHAAPVATEYGTLALALVADERCGLLNIMEHEALRRAVTDFRAAGNQRPQPPDCASDAATTAVAAGRPMALLGLATAAVVSATIGPLTHPLTKREQDLALALNSYLDRVLGADTPQYIDPAQNAARIAIATNAMAARDRLSAVLADASFQGAAEGSGYRANMFAENWVRLTESGGAPIFVGRLSICRSADPAIPTAFECYLMVRNGIVSTFFRDAPGASMPMPAPGVVRLYVRKPDAAVRTAQGRPVASTPAWRSNASGYEGIKNGTAFLGAVVYDFGPLASAALTNQTDNDEAEIAVARGANVPDSAAGSLFNLFLLQPLLAELRRQSPR